MRKAAALFAIAAVSGCGSMYNSDPVGVGYDANELKLSPCACIRLETKPGLPDDMTFNI
ncbi:MAG: hypothetical protein LBT92_00290 [Rickettsiales bacterium]|jgi:hypothetical protein|nr:hypothetical protein [Rickettsiales bacterium]